MVIIKIICLASFFTRIGNFISFIEELIAVKCYLDLAHRSFIRTSLSFGFLCSNFIIIVFILILIVIVIIIMTFLPSYYYYYYSLSLLNTSFYSPNIFIISITQNPNPTPNDLTQPLFTIQPFITKYPTLFHKPSHDQDPFIYIHQDYFTISCAR